MTIEELVDGLALYSDAWSLAPPCCQWKWDGKPVDDDDINYWIVRYDLILCLTSPSEYIREYRQWHERRTNAESNT